MPTFLINTDPATNVIDPFVVSIIIFVLAIFIGFEIITKVPSTLHTPLMSGSNAISGITLVGALLCSFSDSFGSLGVFLGTLAVIFATINVVGGYMVTDRMLKMFSKKEGGDK
ncbi:NAD(P) transhydrogenase subunit alpha [Poriferisphaera corsica]|uniref:proton-translocating NAD(P)(+) transhydrogenase n=1 Tax=Poriferisphaera corsica TaxID=2528020 RepID=A0A517YTC5_9BACT|nr:NAD(P) transhydrogenase subunit alpha [Poriferisphaera corsica]QDU33461.1 NAD(P) transhydrogenase subunit alpha [Poriferisphaera corsica]